MSARPVERDASTGQSARLLLIELNEFNPQFLALMAEQLKLLNTAKIFSMCKAETSTADLVEHQGLDPWVQWVGVHCGKPTTERGIRRLGATRTQTFRQIWHLLAQLVSSGVHAQVINNYLSTGISPPKQATVDLSCEDGSVFRLSSGTAETGQCTVATDGAEATCTDVGLHTR